MSTRVEVMHTGSVIVDKALPYHRDSDRPGAWTHIARRKRDLVELPVSCYLVESRNGLVLIDTGWHTVNRSTPGQIANLRHQYPVNKARLPEGAAINEQLEERGIKPRDLDMVILSHLHCDHADGLRLVKEAPRIFVSEAELRAADRDHIKYLHHEWHGVDLQTFSWNTRTGPNHRAWDVFGDGTVEMIHTPGHSWGLCATVVRGDEDASAPPAAKDSPLGEDPREVIFLASDVGYGRPAFDDHLRPSLVDDATMAHASLEWAIRVRADSRTKNTFANHDLEVEPGTYSIG